MPDRPTDERIKSLLADMTKEKRAQFLIRYALAFRRHVLKVNPRYFRELASGTTVEQLRKAGVSCDTHLGAGHERNGKAKDGRDAPNGTHRR